jgi:CRP-like cAMP-binding protein
MNAMKPMVASFSSAFHPGHAARQPDVTHFTMGADPVLEANFSSHGCCRALTEVAAELLATRVGGFPQRRVAAGRLLYRAGDPTDDVYVVSAGLLRTEQIGPDGEAVLVASHGRGDLVGELCLCQIRARQEQAVAVRESVVAVLSAAAVVDLAARERDTLVAVLEMLCHRVDIARRRLGELGFDSGQRRVALRLLDLATSEGVAVGPGLRAIVRRPSQASLAAAAFVSRELANRVLGDLRARGLVAFDRTGPITVHVARLEESLAKGALARKAAG